MLRQTLRRSEALLGTVEEEVSCVEAYLDVERQRWGERLNVEWDVDQEALDARLPPMTLQRGPLEPQHVCQLGDQGGTHLRQGASCPTCLRRSTLRSKRLPERQEGR